MTVFKILPSRDEWNALAYPVLIQASPDECGGYYASIPLLGEGAFTADGETAQEALDALEELRRLQYDDVVASGVPIPTPVQEEPEASGKWLHRTTPRFHTELRGAAESQGVSLTEYANQCMMIGHAQHTVTTCLEATVARFQSRMDEASHQVRHEISVAASQIPVATGKRSFRLEDIHQELETYGIGTVHNANNNFAFAG